MLSPEMQLSAKVLIVKPGGGSISDDAKCVRMLTRTTLRDSVSDATRSPFSRLGTKILAEEAYVLDVCKRLDRKGNLPGSPISE